MSICFHDAVGRKRGSPEYSLDGVLDARDGEEGGEVGRVGGDDDEREHPPHPHHHARGQRGVRHLSACREETGREKKWASSRVMVPEKSAQSTKIVSGFTNLISKTHRNGGGEGKEEGNQRSTQSSGSPLKQPHISVEHLRWFSTIRLKSLLMLDVDTSRQAQQPPDF